MHGHGMGSHGWGARKKHVGTSGHSGGSGMSGTGKMAGQKKTLVNMLYHGDYFGKQGITSRGTERRDNKVMNLRSLMLNLVMIKEKFGKKENKVDILDMSDYKILGEGELTEKLIIKAKAASASAKEKIQKAGGKLILPIVKEARKYEIQETNKIKNEKPAKKEAEK